MANKAPTSRAELAAAGLEFVRAAIAELLAAEEGQPLGEPPADVTRLLWYHALCEAGVITDAEFTRLKRTVLEAPTPEPKTTPPTTTPAADKTPPDGG